MPMDYTTGWNSTQTMRPLLCPLAGGIACPIQLSLPGRSANQWSAIHGWSTAISSLSAEESTRIFSSTQLNYSPYGALSSVGCSTTARSRWATRSKKPKPKPSNSETAVSESRSFLFTSLQRVPGLPVPAFVPSAQVSRWKSRRSQHQSPEGSPHNQACQVREHACHPYRKGRTSSFQVVSRHHNRHQRRGHCPQHAPRPAQKSPGSHCPETKVGRRSYFASLLDPDTAARCPDRDPQPPGSREEIDIYDFSTDSPHRYGSHRGPVPPSPTCPKLHGAAACATASRDEPVLHPAPVRPRPPRRRPKAGARSFSGLPSCSHPHGRPVSTLHTIPPTRHLGSFPIFSYTTRHAKHNAVLRQRGYGGPGNVWSLLALCLTCITIWQHSGAGRSTSSFWGHSNSGDRGLTSSSPTIHSAHWLRLASGKQGEQALDHLPSD